MDQSGQVAPPPLVTPSHPGYPSGQATMSNARAVVLGYLFPADAQLFARKARETAESRFEGGVCFRTDNTVELALRQEVGAAVLNTLRRRGLERPPRRQ